MIDVSSRRRSMSAALLIALALLLAACGSDDEANDAASQDMVSGDTSTADASGDISQATPSCAAYCEAITANCTGANAQYLDEMDCLGYCGTYAQLPVGAADGSEDNSIGCRQRFAEMADDRTACLNAGPSGNNTCGTWCENYCHLEAVNCTAENDVVEDAMCATSCGSFPDGAEAGAEGGDSVQCRIYHLGVAGHPDNGGPGFHCPHATADGGGVCSP